MEKAITKEMLKSIDIDKVTKEIQKHLSEKSQSDTASEIPTEKSEKKVKKEVIEEKTPTKTKKSKATQKRIPEFNPRLIQHNYSLTSPISNISDSLGSSASESMSYSTVSEF